MNNVHKIVTERVLMHMLLTGWHNNKIYTPLDIKTQEKMKYSHGSETGKIIVCKQGNEKNESNLHLKYRI